MDTQPWSRPVKFETGMGKFRILISTEEASYYLLNDWPTEGGVRYIDAKRACLDVLAGMGQPDDARKAFVTACQEADMPVIP